MQEKDTLLRDQTDRSLQDWHEKEKAALRLLQLAGDLRFDQNTELVLFRNSIYDSRPSELLHQHLVALNYSDTSIEVQDTLHLAEAIARVKDLPPAKIDLGKLALEWGREGADYPNVDAFIGFKLNGLQENNTKAEPAKDVILYGFGRIGRLVARRIVDQTGAGDQLRLKAIVLRPKMQDRFQEVTKRASLLETDTVHGNFAGTISVAEDGSEMIINGNRVQVIFAKSPNDIDYTHYGIKNALLIDNTGVWRDREALSIHLRPGVDQVMLTAPAKDVPNIVHGVNQSDLNLETDTIFCAASCTTNAISPVLSALEQRFGIEKGHLETIHAYTSDQNLLDNFHKKPRRGRGAATNMVLTSTGAAKAVAKVIPGLKGKLTGNAVRVPTPNVSLAILNLSLKKTTQREELNNFLQELSLKGDLVEQLHYSNSTEYVSSTAVGMTATSVVDAPSTIVSADGQNITLYLWYDNEYGYTCQVVRLAKYAARVRRAVYY
ncbi:MAG: glyceraldehyde-3-phosphate dehydrogenase [Bacteroidota bacterium]